VATRPQERLLKLEAALAPVRTSLERRIADLLSVPVNDCYATVDFNPWRKKEKIFEASSGEW
jgi:hypothetical protein